MQPFGSLPLNRPSIVTRSSDLVGDFEPLDNPLTVTPDNNGEGQTIIPNLKTSDLKEFYRIEE